MSIEFDFFLFRSVMQTFVFVCKWMSVCELITKILFFFLFKCVSVFEC